jgi:hypothetical protein
MQQAKWVTRSIMWGVKAGPRPRWVAPGKSLDKNAWSTRISPYFDSPFSITHIKVRPTPANFKAR